MWQCHIISSFTFQPPAGPFYPLHLLYTTNYRLPGDVDRANLERHMADTDFEVTISYHYCYYRSGI